MNNAEKARLLLEALKRIANEASKTKASRLKIKEIAVEAVEAVERQ